LAAQDVADSTFVIVTAAIATTVGLRQPPERRNEAEMHGQCSSNAAQL
jgi:hypothetical protein